MAYTKTVWANGTAPAINATNLNKIEQGIADALPLDGSAALSGQLIVVGGTTATPSIVSTLDADTGILFPSAGRLSIASNGTEVIYCHSNQNVGIGHNAPTAKLDVSGAIQVRGAATTGAAITITPDATTGTNGTIIANSFATGGYGNLYIQNGGSTRLTVGADGNIGIGIPNPSNKIHLYQANTNAQYISISNATSTFLVGQDTSGNLVNFTNQAMNFIWSNSGTEKARLDTSGQLGIGTASPSAPLTVFKSKLDAGVIPIVSYQGALGTGTSGHSIEFKQHTTYTTGFITCQATGGGGGTDIIFGNTSAYGTADATEKMRIQRDGKVGIGTATPQRNLEISTAVNTYQRLTTTIDASCFLEFHTNSVLRAQIQGDGNGLAIGSVTNTPIYFNTNNTEKMRLSANGSLGIGTLTNTTRKLEIDATGVAVPPLRLTNANNNVGIEYVPNATYYSFLTATGYNASNTFEITPSTTAGGTTYTTPAFTVRSNGNIGMGVTSSSYLLQLGLDSAAKPSTNTWTIASDERVKNVTGEYTKGLDAICALRPVTYEYNGKAGFAVDGKENISIIAQEAIEHFPECVGTFNAKLEETDEQETELYNWNGHAITFALINAVKELKAEIEFLKAKLK